MSTSSQRDHSQIGHMAVAPVLWDETGTLEAHEIVVHALTTEARTLTMPVAGDALAGVPYIIKLETDGGNLTVAYPEGSHNPADVVLTAVDDYVISMSDGTYWYIIGEVST